MSFCCSLRHVTATIGVVIMQMLQHTDHSAIRSPDLGMLQMRRMHHIGESLRLHVQTYGFLVYP